MKNVLALALVISVASIALSQAPAPKPDPNKQPQRWEYKIEKRGGHIEQPEIWEKTLNDMAKDGWKLDQINQDKFYIFRRPGCGAAPM